MLRPIKLASIYVHGDTDDLRVAPGEEMSDSGSSDEIEIHCTQLSQLTDRDLMDAIATQLLWQVEVDRKSGIAVAHWSSGILTELRDLSDFKEPDDGYQCQQLLEYSPLNGISDGLRHEVVKRFGFARSTTDSERASGASEGRRCSHDRAVGALVGLVVGDAVGAPLEFLNACSEKSSLHSVRRVCRSRGEGSTTEEDDELEYDEPYNKFAMKPGQFTDDSSMALCLADSLIFASTAGARAIGRGTASAGTSIVGYDGGDLRLRFNAWWMFGYNNAFRHDDERTCRCRLWGLLRCAEKSQEECALRSRTSVGLGGNIYNSFEELWRAWRLGQNLGGVADIPEETGREGNDSGNGSIMRLAPVAVRFSRARARAVAVAEKQSRATHPGRTAADTAKFLAYILARAIESAPDSSSSPRHTVSQPLGEGAEASGRLAMMVRFPMQGFLDQAAHDFLIEFGESLDETVKHLVLADDRHDKREAHWNWKSQVSKIDAAVAGRGEYYNGYGNDASYFGSYCIDGLAIALQACYWSRNFDEAVLTTVNHLGDADTTGAIAGQIAGAFYGMSGIPSAHVRRLSRWDRGDTLLRAAILRGLQEVDTS